MQDDEIIRLYRSGDRERAFSEIVKAYSERLFWYVRRFVCCHEDADDLIQEIFIKVWAALPSFREEARLYTWIYRIATHEAMNLIAKNKHPRELLQSIDSTTANAAADSYIDYSDVEAVRLQKAILSLPPKQQVVFNLRYYDDMDYSHIAEITETSPSTAKVNYHLAKEKVIKYMTTND